MRIYYSLYDRLLDRRAMARAFEKVRRAQGAPGVDRQTIADFQSRLWEELDQLVTELRNRTYQPEPGTPWLFELLSDGQLSRYVW